MRSEPTQGRPRSFALIEVVIATGIFVAGIAVVLGLLSGLSVRAREHRDLFVVRHLPGALSSELKRVAAGDFDAFAAALPVAAASPIDGLAFVADQNGAVVQSRDYSPPESGLLAESDRYFLIECWRFPGGALQYDPTRALLALQVRVSWPYRLPGSTGPAIGNLDHHVTFVCSVVR